MTGCLPVIATSPCGYFLDFGTVRGGGGGGVGMGWGGVGGGVEVAACSAMTSGGPGAK